MKIISIPFIVALILLGLSVFCYVSEVIFYDTIDENGYLRESFFLPLSFIFLGFGLAVFMGWGVRKIIKLNSLRNKIQSSMPIEN